MNFESKLGPFTMNYISAGNYKSCCFGLVTLGTQKFENKDNENLFLARVLLLWEVHEEVTSKMKHDLNTFPSTISKEYTLSWSQSSSLRSDLEAFRGKPFTNEETRRMDLKSILGNWCNLEISDFKSSDGNVYSRIKEISFLKNKQKNSLQQSVHKLMLFNIHEPDWETYESLDPYIKERLQKAIEWKKLRKY